LRAKERGGGIADLCQRAGAATTNQIVEATRAPFRIFETRKVRGTGRERTASQGRKTGPTNAAEEARAPVV